ALRGATAVARAAGSVPLYGSPSGMQPRSPRMEGARAPPGLPPTRPRLSPARRQLRRVPRSAAGCGLSGERRILPAEPCSAAWQRWWGDGRRRPQHGGGGVGPDSQEVERGLGGLAGLPEDNGSCPWKAAPRAPGEKTSEASPGLEAENMSWIKNEIAAYAERNTAVRVALGSKEEELSRSKVTLQAFQEEREKLQRKVCMTAVMAPLPLTRSHLRGQGSSTAHCGKRDFWPGVVGSGLLTSAMDVLLSMQSRQDLIWEGLNPTTPTQSRERPVDRDEQLPASGGPAPKPPAANGETPQLTAGRLDQARLRASPATGKEPRGCNTRAAGVWPCLPPELAGATTTASFSQPGDLLLRLS
uniref:Uncharacterized protein n=1 Tax=Terrapene triunguis TaxID=2587831 RepID=A0A674I9F5_9SAUR